MGPEIKRLAGSFGAEVSGIDLNDEIGANLFRTRVRQPLAPTSGRPDARAVEPLVRTQTETERKSLDVSQGYTTSIVGLAPAESRILCDHVSLPAAGGGRAAFNRVTARGGRPPRGSS